MTGARQQVGASPERDGRDHRHVRVTTNSPSRNGKELTSNLQSRNNKRVSVFGSPSATANDRDGERRRLLRQLINDGERR
ncbi:hypothetical protein U9M48_042016 [Paspalum notatum var. saurae]|uniref:Uncharacterized protein n=1 Tax=Paspalum notatum var. saurae TaxID=547442 RepID=A0AAQ3UU93_PASNO